MNPKRQKAKTDYLISGTSSGLGKYLLGQLGGIPLNRKDPKESAGKIIIHCAFNRGNEAISRNLYQYLSDNIFLTETLVHIPHQKFIYISTVDVYPNNGKKHAEDEVINLEKVATIYGSTKLMAESIVQNLSPNFLILRCSALLGGDTRENSLIKIIKQRIPKLTLSADSVFNYILHSDILELIKIAVEKDLQGIYNVGSSKNITLSEVAVLLKKKVNFGNYKYNAGKINNAKARKYLPKLKKTSKEMILEFLS